MTIQVTINSNNPLVAGVYTAPDQPTMLSTLAPVLALISPISPACVDDAVHIFTVNGHVAFLAYM